MIQQIVRIYDVVDQFLWKLFEFFKRIFSTSGQMILKNMELKTLAAIAVRVMHL